LDGSRRGALIPVRDTELAPLDGPIGIVEVETYPCPMVACRSMVRGPDLPSTLILAEGADDA
jgi:hypothetical protein